MRIVVIALALACAVPAIAKAPPKPAPKAEPAKPDHVDDVDYLRARAALAEDRASQAEAELASRKAKDAHEAADRVLNELRAKYQITPTDRVADDAGHKITRVK